MSEVMTLPAPTIPVGRKCKMEEVFEPNFIELIRLVPANPYVRALILKLTGKMPRLEHQSFEQIQEWVETTCEKKARKRAAGVYREGISIRVEFSETEYGRATYSVRRSGTDRFQISAEDLLEIVQEAINAGGGMDEAVERIAGKIDDDAWNQCEPNMDDYGEYDYGEHNSNDSEDCETEYSQSEIRTALLAFVRDYHPELAAEV
jgi:hypothetical protein